MEAWIAHFLDESMLFSAEDVTRLTGLTLAELEELADCGLTPIVDAAGVRRYSSGVIAAGRRAARLRAVFELDSAALMLVTILTHRIDELQNRVNEMDCAMPRAIAS